MADIGHNNPDVSIDYVDLRALLDEVGNTAKAVTEANGRHRSKIKEILEDREWNKTAFGDLRKIDNMSETARADYLRTFVPLLEVMREAKWDAEGEDLLSGLGDDDESEDNELDMEDPDMDADE